MAQQQAQIRSDDAAIANARTLLGYAAITAPIGGVTGIRQVDAGNVVRSQTDGIVVIAQVQPISVLFTVPERALSSVMTGAKSGPLIAEAYTTDGNQVLDAGELKVVDNQVDPTTGTVRLKADFPDSNRQLWPGQFVNVRLRVDTLKNVVVVPTPSVQQGPSGAFVYLAKGDGTVAVTLVTVGQQTEQRTVVTAGLAPGDSVVGSGFARLKDGAKIEQLARGSNKPMVPDGSRPDVPATGGNPPEAQVGSKCSGSEPASAGPEAAVAGPLPVKPADGSGLAGWTKGSGKQRHRNAADGNAIAGGAPGDGTGTAKDAAQ